MGIFKRKEMDLPKGIIEAIEAFPPGLICVRAPNPQAVQPLVQALSSIDKELSDKGFSFFVYTGPLTFHRLSDGQLRQLGLEKIKGQ